MLNENGRVVFDEAGGHPMSKDDLKAMWIETIRRNEEAEEMQGSSSEVLMCAFALGRWDEVPSSWRRDPWAAWSRRLDDEQRAAVEEWRRG